MTSLAFKKKITKRAFETKMITDFGHDALSKEIIKETDWDKGEPDFPVYITVNCYYIQGVHVGSWCKGQGWVFDHAYSADEMTARVKELEALDIQLGMIQHAD
jgi:hypothetical protein